MADKKVNIKFTADSKNAKKGVDNVTSSLNKLSKEASSDPLTKLKKSWEGATSTIKGAGLAAVIGGEVKILKEELKAIKETAEAFNVQLEVETKLAQAAKNNPYLNDESVGKLKAYASELQTIGNYGDEELIPMMATLAASGRTEAQIMEIMSASLDVAAGSGESLETTVKNLSKTLNGEAGEIADFVPELKTLTKEQLKSGEAIKIAAEQYKGISKAAVDATGSAKQLEMAQGDLKETIGSITQPAYNAWNSFWYKQTQNAQSFVSKLSSGLDYINEHWVIGGAYNANKDYVEDMLENAKKIQESRRYDYFTDNAIASSDKDIELTISYLSKLKHANAEEKRLLQAFQEEQKHRETKLRKDKARAEAEEEAALFTTSELKKQLAILEKSNDNSMEYYQKLGAYSDELEKRVAEEQAHQDALLEQYNKSVTAKQTEIDTRKEAGVQISKEAEQQEMLNTKLQAYVDFIRNGGDSHSTAAEKIRADIKAISADLDEAEQARIKREQAEAEAEERKKLADEEEKKRNDQIKAQLDSMNDKVLQLKNDAMELLGEHQEEEKLSDTISKTIDILEDEAEALDKTSEAYKEYIEKIKELKDLLPEVQKAEEAATTSSETSIMKVQSVMGTITESLQSLSTSISSICNTALSASQREYDEDSKSLDMQLDRNLITYDEYLNKKNELDKQAAQKEYKIKMAEWSMNLALATAQAATAVVNALASGTPPVNIINAVSAGLLGAAQIVTIAASKPTPPSFSTGGFLTGNSYSGDKIPFMGNAGEAILNPAEQRNFLDLANGSFNGGVSLVQPINIVNNAGDQVAVSASTQDRQIKVTIDKIVNSGLQNGTYNNGLQSANASMQGAKYL